MTEKKLNNIKWGIVLTYIILAVNIISSIFYTPIMLRILGPSEHGLYNTVASTMSWLNLLSLGLGSGYIRYYSIYKTNNKEQNIHKLNGLYLITFSVLGIVALLLGILMLQNLQLFFGDGLTASEYSLAKILSIFVVVDLAISFPVSVFNAIIRAQEQFILAKSLNLFQAIMHPLVILPLLFWGYGSIGVVVANLAINVITYTFNIIFCLKKLHIKFAFKGFEKGLLKKIFVFSFFVALNSVINQVNTSLDKVLLARFINTTSVSVYTIGFSLYSYYSAFSSAISGVFAPRINNIVNRNKENKENLKKEQTAIFIKIGRLQFYIQMLMLTGIIFFGKQFVHFWAGPGYEEAYYITILLSVAYTVPLCQGLGVEMQRAQNKHQIRTIVYLIMTFANIILTIILCQIWGGFGAAFATAISVIVVEVIFMNIYYHHKINIDIVAFWKNILRISVGLIFPIAFGVSIMLWVPINEIWQLLGCIVLYSVIYCLSMMFLSFNKEEKKTVFKRMRKVFKKSKTYDNK